VQAHQVEEFHQPMRLVAVDWLLVLVFSAQRTQRPVRVEALARLVLLLQSHQQEPVRVALVALLLLLPQQVVVVTAVTTVPVAVAVAHHLTETTQERVVTARLVTPSSWRTCNASWICHT
jgi:hypothetical protein